MVFNIERNYSKDEILELYVNTSYLVDGYTGVREESLGYFEKEETNKITNRTYIICCVWRCVPFAKKSAQRKRPQREILRLN